MSTVLPDPATEYGQRVARRLREEIVIWLTTVGADGTPQPTPVWFHWDGTSFLIYSLANARRVAHIRRQPRVALHFDSDGRGGNIIVFTGEARFTTDDPPADQVPEYVAKYQDRIARMRETPATFAADYSVTLRVTPTRVRGF